MLAEIHNLRMARKAKARAEAARLAETNRMLHGRTAAEKRDTAARGALAERRLDGHRREPSDGDA